jgi:hypothetical protein
VRPDHPTPAGPHIALHRLLGACGERPGTGAAEQRDEIAADHSITSSARPSRVVGTLKSEVTRFKQRNISATIVVDVKRFDTGSNGRGFRYTQVKIARRITGDLVLWRNILFPQTHKGC